MINKRLLSWPLLIAGLVLPLCAASFDVRSYGARGDGKTLDTDAINAAIAAAAKAGGGTVEFPAGEYASYSIRLQSNVTLYLGPGSTIIAAEPSADLSQGYDAPEPNPGVDQYQDFGHSHWHNSLIWGENLENIGIIGPGKIYGRGLSRGSVKLRRDLHPGEAKEAAAQLAFPQAIRDQIAAIKPGPFGYPSNDTLPAGVGNKSISLKNCRNVILRDITLFHAGHFAVLATGVDNLLCDNLKIDTNRDGIDIDCCRNVRITNCTVNSPRDDAICLKSSFGLGYNRVTENVTISDCQVSAYIEGTLLDGRCIPYPVDPNGRHPSGRIKMGTESNGGFKNIAITNCIFDNCRGFTLQAVDGAIIEDIAVSNLTMRHIYGAPIFIRLGRRLRAPEGAVIGAIRRVKIENLVVSDARSGEGGAILIVGTPGHPVEDVSLRNILVQFQGGGREEDAMRVPPEDEPHGYPESPHFGVLPSWGMYARHVKNLSVADVQLQHITADLRPAIWLEDAAGVDLTQIKIPTTTASTKENIVTKEVTGLTLQQSPTLSRAGPK